MKELEDTKCEIRRCIDLQLSIWDGCGVSADEEGIPPLGSPGYNGGSSTPLGNFLEDAAYAWLSNGPRLVVINVKTGTSISSWTFRDKVTCVSSFAAQPGQVPLLLVGLDNGANKLRDSSGLVCVFDCTKSQVLRAIRMPAGVEQVCVIMSGVDGEDLGDKRSDNLIRENSGLACVALRNLDHLIIDLRRTSWEGPEAEPVADESNPADLYFSERNETSSSRHKYSIEKHAAYNLMNSRLEQYIDFNRDDIESSLYRDALTSSIVCSRKIGCLISGCLGRIIIWEMDGAVRWVSPQMDETMSISHLALLEPTDDPRPFCYLWAAYHDDNSQSPSILRMWAMLFDRKYTEKGTNVYQNLESDPTLKFTIEINDDDSIINICSIIREINPEQTESGNKRGEDSLLLINLTSRTLLFDLNQWYKEQMPHTLNDCQNPNVFLASYKTRSTKIRSTIDDIPLDIRYSPESLKEFPSNGPSPPEELFYPNSLSLEWMELGTKKFTIRSTRGLQSELLREISQSGPSILIEPSTIFKKCMSHGLIPNNVDVMVKSSDKDHQRETLLSLCLEQRWSQFLLKCGKDWSDGSASYLFHSFIRWAMQRASTLKIVAHRLCVPLYDQSDTGIGESEIKPLRFFAQQLDCISNVVNNLTVDNFDLTKQRQTLKRLATYLQVLLWFYDVGLLPETQNFDDENLPMSFSLKIPYPYERLAILYREKRRGFNEKKFVKKLENEEELFIDELINRECSPLKSQWEREGGESTTDGNYPPPSLQSLLRSYLTDCENVDSNEMNNKHQITIYLLMDLAMLLQGCCPGVDQLIKYPSAFKLSPSLIKLTQALWLLDHEDYQGFLDMMTGQLVSDCDVKDWHHKLVLRTLIRNDQNKLALIYLRVRKPPLSSIDDQSTVISLTVEHGLVQSAFHRRPSSHYAQLLTRFFQSCKIYGKLNDILHLSLNPIEEDAFVKFLDNEKSHDTRLLYYLQRCRHAEASAVHPLLLTLNNRGNSRESKQSSTLNVYAAYNTTLPEITRRFTSNCHRRNLEIDPNSRYPRPMSHSICRGKNRDLHDNVMKKARETFLRGDRTQVPFVSAPCSSLKPGTENVESNCVTWVQRVRKPYGKRTSDDMVDEIDANVSRKNGDDRKRRKTSDVDDATLTENDVKQMGMSMVFDTPLVKRKNQMINARNSGVETPQSILKVRQMIRESTSPGLTRRSASLDEIEERERKPRQIRFSIGQQRIETSTEDTMEDNDDEETIEGRTEVNEEIDESDRSNIVAADLDLEHEEEIETNETYFSPEIGKKIEIGMESDDFTLRKVSSGPRPRPSLRGTSQSSLAMDSGKDDLRRSVMKIETSKRLSWTPSSTDSMKIVGNLSTSSGERKNVDVTDVPPSPRPRASLLSTSIYSTSILSSDTSFDDTTTNDRHVKSSIVMSNTLTSFVERSIDKYRDYTGIRDDYEVTENFVNVNRVGEKKCIVDRDENEKNVERPEEDENSEILMEVDGFGLDRDSETRSRADFDGNWEIGDKPVSFGIDSIGSSTMMIEESRKEVGEVVVDGNYEETKVEEGLDDRSTELPTIDQTTGVIDELKQSEDYDDELMALRYEEDEEDEEDEEKDREETFESFPNSIEVDLQEQQENRQSKTTMATIISTIDDASNEKSKIGSHDFDITDDESSTSLGASVTNESTIVDDRFNDKPIFMEKIIENAIDEASNITDDESNGTQDSSVFSNEIRDDPNPTKSAKIGNETDSNDSSIFSTEIRKDSEVKKNRSTIDGKKNRLPIDDEKNRSPIDEEKIVGNETDSNNSTDSSIFSRNSRKIVDSQDTPKKWKIGNETTVDREAIGSTKPVASFKPENNANDEQEDDKEASIVEKLRRSAKKSKNLTPKKSKISREIEEQTEIAETTPLRVTRSRRASSIATEIPISPLPISPIVESTATSKIGRLRRSSSLATEIFSSTESKNIRGSSVTTDSPIKRSLNRRSASVAKEIFSTKTIEESPKNDEDLPIRRSTRRAASSQREISEASKTPVKVRKSSSKVTGTLDETVDEEIAIGKKKTRTKRSESVGKESEIVAAATAAPPSSKRSTRGSSSVKEIAEENDTDVPESTIPKRSTRAASIVKEISENDDNDLVESTIVKRSTRAASIVKEITDDEDTDFPESTIAKRSTRAASIVKEITDDEDTDLPKSTIPKRLTRAASVVRDQTIVDDEKKSANEKSVTPIKRGYRKRANSVPKEIEVTTKNSSTRLRRAGSVVDDSSTDKDQSIVEDGRKNRNVVGKIGKVKPSSSSATSGRVRLTSISSIPEEDDEEIFGSSTTTTKAPTTTAAKKRTTIARERRAASVDAEPRLESKRRITRAGSVKRCTSEDTIVEEPSETVEANEGGSRRGRRAASTTSTTTTTRRKRTASVTSVREEDEEADDAVFEELPQRRMRKLSQRSNETTESYRFSPPDRAHDEPDDDDRKEMGDVPDYVFSPPHTRSKDTSIIRPRRTIKDFIPLTEKERMAAKRVPRPRIAPIEKPTKKSMDLWSPRAGFVLPKRYNSTSD